MFQKNVSGQVSSIDLMVASIIFILIFVSMRGLWLENVSGAQEDFSLSDMQLKGESALDSLLKTQGYPANWSPSTVDDNTLLGIANSPLVLSSTKVANFAAYAGTNYDKAVYLLALGNDDFNFSLVSDNPAYNISAGVPVRANSTVISLKRVVTYKGVGAYVVFKIFSK